MNRPINQSEQSERRPPEINLETVLVNAAQIYEASQLALSGEDELLSSLSNAYENRRARQVFEWETIRRRAESTTAARSFV